MTTALILSGAGARGIIQTGMLSAFWTLGLEYDTLYGSSAGALNGAMFHAGDLNELHELWLTVRNKDVYDNAPWNMLLKNKGSLYDASPLKKLIKKVVNVQKLRANPKAFWTNVSNLNSWKPMRVHQATEYILDYLWASACPPILFPPVADPCTADWLTDGAIMNNYSISDAVNDGHDRLIVFAPLIPEPKPIKTIIDAIDVTVSIQLYNQLIRELKFVEKLNGVEGFRKIEVVLVTLEQPSGIGIFDFDQTYEDRLKFLGLGYTLAWKKLKPIYDKKVAA